MKAKVEQHRHLQPGVHLPAPIHFFRDPALAAVERRNRAQYRFAGTGINRGARELRSTQVCGFNRGLQHSGVHGPRMVPARAGAVQNVLMRRRLPRRWHAALSDSRCRSRLATVAPCTVPRPMINKPEPTSGLKGHALYLNIDGTILDLAARPETVEVPCEIVPLMRQLAATLDGAVAFVSGRTISAIDALFAPLRFPAIGVHGGEVRTPEGQIVRDQQLGRELAEVAPLLRQAVAHVGGGVLLEDKGSAIALHYRTVPDRGREVLRVAEFVIADADMATHFAITLGKCVVEICPRHLTKSAALLQMMERSPFRGRTPIYAGDDVTDEGAFELVNRLGGISLRVGDDAPSAASFRLPDPARMRGWLQEIAGRATL
jgi:trehalose 6-phosphate phosphatase